MSRVRLHDGACRNVRRRRLDRRHGRCSGRCRLACLGPHGTGSHFFRFDADTLLGYGGLEGDGPDRLLRSLVVLPDRRKRGVGGKLIAVLEHQAFEAGALRLHLLTNTAARFFRAHGYADADRATAPAPIAALSQFSSICPASAAYLVKSLDRTA